MNLLRRKSVFISYYSARGGGAEQDIPKIVEILLSSGWTVHLVSPKGLASNSSEFFHHYETQPLRSEPFARSISALLYSLHSLAVALRVSRRERIDIAYIMLLQDTPIGLVLKWLNRRTRVIYSIHSDGVGLTLLGKTNWPGPLIRLYSIFLESVERMAVAKSDLVLVISEGLKNRIRARYPELNFDSSKVIPNSVDGSAVGSPDELRKYIGAQEGPVIGFLGKITRAKGVYDLVVAFEIVKMTVPTASLVFIGEGPEEDGVKSLVAQKALTNVHFLGWKDDVFPLVSGFDILVLPSYSEGFGRAVLVGMSCGVVTLGSNVEGLADLLHNESLMFPPGDAQVIADRIVSFVTNENEYTKAREYCTRRVQEFKFSRPERVVGEIKWISER